MTETYNLLGVEAKDISSLEKYLQDYFTNILKKLKDIKAQSKQTDIYFWEGWSFSCFNVYVLDHIAFFLYLHKKFVIKNSCANDTLNMLGLIKYII